MEFDGSGLQKLEKVVGLVVSQGSEESTEPVSVSNVRTKDATYLSISSISTSTSRW